MILSASAVKYVTWKMEKEQLRNKKYNEIKDKTGKALDPNELTFSQELIRLLVKVAFIALFFVLIFSFIFGCFRYSDLSMEPSVKDGDMVITYKWDKRYKAGDLVVFWPNDDPMVSRVFATAGDTVDIVDGTVKVNNAVAGDLTKYGKTYRVSGGVTFPLKVPSNQIFVLGDNREVASDSRTLGCIDVDKTEGKIIGLFRHRGL